MLKVLQYVGLLTKDTTERTARYNVTPAAPLTGMVRVRVRVRTVVASATGSEGTGKTIQHDQITTCTTTPELALNATKPADKLLPRYSPAGKPWLK